MFSEGENGLNLCKIKKTLIQYAIKVTSFHLRKLIAFVTKLPDTKVSVEHSEFIYKNPWRQQ